MVDCKGVFFLDSMSFYILSLGTIANTSGNICIRVRNISEAINFYTKFMQVYTFNGVCETNNESDFL